MPWLTICGVTPLSLSYAFMERTEAVLRLNYTPSFNLQTGVHNITLTRTDSQLRAANLNAKYVLQIKLSLNQVDVMSLNLQPWAKF